jgi:hypothetical protein
MISKSSFRVVALAAWANVTDHDTDGLSGTIPARASAADIVATILSQERTAEALTACEIQRE